MKILLSGPGTGKTTRIKAIIDDEFAGAKKIVVLSFTNFTVEGLKRSFEKYENVECSTLHKFALELNPLKGRYIFANGEDKILERIAEHLGCGGEDLFEILNCITFQGMISECAVYLTANPKHVEMTYGKADLLLVDEYQDFNESEQVIIDELSKIAIETIILGDDDQSIYGFKDAAPDRIISIFNDGKVEKIPHEHNCYRCPDEIIDKATPMIAKNTKRVAKDWHKTGRPGKVIFKQLGTLAETDDDIVETITKIKTPGIEETVLILSPFGALVQKLKDKLVAAGLEVNDCMPMKIDPDIVQRMWWMNAIYTEDINPFIALILWKVTGSKKNMARDLVKDIVEKGLDRHAIVKRIQDEKILQAPFSSYLENAPALDEFFKTHTEFADFDPYIDRGNQTRSVRGLGSAINPPKDLKKGVVNLMSIHKSKGLEADFVFITGLVRGILPNDSRGLDTIEAQRRLLFVAMTRAEKDLYLYSPVEWERSMLMGNMADMNQFANRSRFLVLGKSSGFISEMNL